MRKVSIQFLVVVLLSCDAREAMAGFADQLQRLSAPNPVENDPFGRDVAIDGETAVVSGTSVFVFDAKTGKDRFTLDPPQGEFEFGKSVAVSGKRVAVGSPRVFAPGAVFVFDAGRERPPMILEATQGAVGNRFGEAVDIWGNTAIVGAWRESGTPGAAYLFDVVSGKQISQLVPQDVQVGNSFGRVVGIGDQLAIVGAEDDEDNGVASGAAYIFDANSGRQLLKLHAPDGDFDDLFGSAVAIDGTKAIVGAWGDDDHGETSGSAYVFDALTGDELFKLTPSDGAVGAGFGWSVDISGQLAVVGAFADTDDQQNATGAAYLFDLATGQQLAKLRADDSAPNQDFGNSVSLSQNHVIVGRPLRNLLSPNLNSGAAYVFDTATTQLLAGDANQDLSFDQLDLVRVQQAAKYLTGVRATWGEGDWNAAPGGSPGNPPRGDSLFNQQDIIAALRGSAYLTGPYAALFTSDGHENGTMLVLDDAVGLTMTDGGVLNEPLDVTATLVRAASDIAQVSVPEPSGLALALAGMLVLAFRRIFATLSAFLVS